MAVKGLDYVSGEGCAGVVHIALQEPRRGMASWAGVSLGLCSTCPSIFHRASVTITDSDWVSHLL